MSVFPLIPSPSPVLVRIIFANSSGKTTFLPKPSYKLKPDWLNHSSLIHKRQTDEIEYVNLGGWFCILSMMQ